MTWGALGLGMLLVVLSYLYDSGEAWVDRSDMFLVGVLISALGMISMDRRR